LTNADSWSDPNVDRDYDSGGRPFNYEFEIETVNGDHARMLEQQQVAAILEVIEWFSRPKE
jgi:hypothetical protein